MMSAQCHDFGTMLGQAIVAGDFAGVVEVDGCLAVGYFEPSEAD